MISRAFPLVSPDTLRLALRNSDEIDIDFRFRAGTIAPNPNPASEASLMLMCHCIGVSDRAVRNAIRNGAATTEEVGQACGAGSRCGGCRPAIESLIDGESIRQFKTHTPSSNTTASNDS